MAKGNLIVEQVIAKLENDAANELHSIMGMLEVIAEGPMSKSQQSDLRNCRASADRLLRKVRDISEFLRPEIGLPKISEFELLEVVAGVTGLMEVLAERKGVSLTYEVPPGTNLRLAGARERVEDILFRILENSIRCTDRGWIKLAVQAGAEDSPDFRIEFTVRDSGASVSTTAAARFADPLGIDLPDDGLGLPIIRKWVHAIGGELSVGLEETGGSWISASLPFTRVPPLPGPLVPDQADDPARPLNILVAEDSDDSYFLLEAYLRGQRHRLTRTADGFRAIEMFKIGGYDLVLMDVHMPEMDGFAAVRAMREWETTRTGARVPIVILSSDSMARQIQSGARAGCSGYLTKPLSKKALFTALRQYAPRETPI